MAKQTAVVRFKGKLGNIVGYKQNTSSKSSSSEDFARIRVTDVSNPRTRKQARQRAKAVPAQMFYQAFEPVLNHAFFPASSNVKNKNRFLALAMKNAVVPNVVKGQRSVPITVPYQVSQGSLGLDYLCVAGPGNGSMQLLFSLPGSSLTANSGTTVGNFSFAVLSANPVLEAGMELSFLVLLVADNDPNAVIAQHWSIVLNEGDSITTLGDLGWYEDISAVISSNGTEFECSTLGLAAGALIISSKASSSWRYTNSYLGQTAFGEGFDSNYEEVIASYMNPDTTATSSLILQQANNAADAGKVVLSGIQTAASYDVKPTIQDTDVNASAAIMSNGQRLPIVNAEGYLVTRGDGVWTVVTRKPAGEGATPVPVALTDTTCDGMTAISTADMEAAGF